MARKRLFPNSHDLTALQLRLLHVVFDHPSIPSGAARLQMAWIAPQAVGRAASTLCNKGLLYYDYNWDMTDGKYEYWPTDEGHAFVRDNWELMLAVAKHYGATDDEIEHARKRGPA